VSADSLGHQPIASIVKVSKAKTTKKLTLKTPKDDGTDYHVILSGAGSAYYNPPVWTVGKPAQIAFMTAAPAGMVRAYLARETDATSVLLGSFPHTPGPDENVSKTYSVLVPNVPEGGDYFIYPDYVSADGKLKLGGERHPHPASISYLRVVK